MGLSAHYLDIEWESPGVARRITVSTYPIEIDTGKDGALHMEVSIFRNFAPWVGLKLSGDLANIEPASIDAQSERHPWLRVIDKQGGVWWIPVTGWSKPNNRHLSEMHRAFGNFFVELGPYASLTIDAVAYELDRAHAQEYLDDFRDDLVWLAIGKPTGALGEVGYDHIRDLVEALAEFADAAGRVLDNPAQEIGEITALTAPARLRPNAETFRAAMRRPGARLYPGRAAEASADIPENRYLRGLILHCWRLAGSVKRSSSRHQGHLTARSVRAKQHGADLLETERIEVDQKIFDNQLADIQRLVDAIAHSADGLGPPGHSEREYELMIRNKFNGNGGGFFYQILDSNGRWCADHGFHMSVVNFPEGLHELVTKVQTVDRHIVLKLVGEARFNSFTTGNNKSARRVRFTRVSAVEARSPVLEHRKATRLLYERDGWHRPINHKERKEYRAEANTALIRASQFDARAQTSAKASAALGTVENTFIRQDASWDNLGVLASSMFPIGLRFVQNPLYANALAAFHKVLALEQSRGIGGETLEKLGRINILHASALYERWCLIKIIAVLVQDFGFTPPLDWVDHVLKFSSPETAPRANVFSINFTREHPGMTAKLDVEPILVNGRRPDFRLRFAVSAFTGHFMSNDNSSSSSRSSIFGNLLKKRLGLVMDAKFRTRWKDGELDEMRRMLVDTKDYGLDGDRVFIIHPAKGAVEHRTSPLIWSSDCDYGQNHPTDHSSGSIQLGADPVAAGASTINLRRLIALELQKVFPKPYMAQMSETVAELGYQWGEPDEVCHPSASICIACGKGHEVNDVTQGKTESGNLKWFYRCSGCGNTAMRTPCFGCGSELYKNGQQMTYHLTIADQLSNVVCPDCGVNF